MEQIFEPFAFINGCWVTALDGARFAITDPASNEVIANVADCGANEAAAAVNAAEQALVRWSRRSAFDRGAILRRWRDLIITNTDGLSRLLTREMGKPTGEAKSEIAYGAAFLDWFAEEGKRAYGETIPSPWGDSRILTLRQPVGVVAAITPWNFPNAMVLRKVAPALAAGCTIIVKPAEATPLSALAIAALSLEAGLPPGVLNILPTSRPHEVGDALLSAKSVRKLSFTGSTETGKILTAKAAATMKRVSMELGGNAPFIVFEDADLAAAIEGALLAKFRNGGQTCVCANRFLVHAAVHDAFMELIVKRTEEMVVGPGSDRRTEIGPLIDESAVAKVEALLLSAVAAGATVLLGGKRHPLGGHFFEPTVISNVQPEMDIAREEIFGPVVAITRFETEAEAIALANDTEFGLAAYVYTKDFGRAWRVGEALECGMVAINEGILSTEVAPFGGVKSSGLGREGSRHGLEEYLTVKYMLAGGLKTSEEVR